MYKLLSWNSGNTFDAASNQVFRLRIADQGSIGASSLRLRYTIVNHTANAFTTVAQIFESVQAAQAMRGGAARGGFWQKLISYSLYSTNQHYKLHKHYKKTLIR